VINISLTLLLNAVNGHQVQFDMQRILKFRF